MYVHIVNILSETDSLLILKSVPPYSEPLHNVFTIWRVYCNYKFLYARLANFEARTYA